MTSHGESCQLPLQVRALEHNEESRHRMRRVFGLETEYGITLCGAESVDVVAESIELVRRYTDHGALMKWDYDLEDPHLDARGFRATTLGEIVAQDKAGERILAECARRRNEKLPPGYEVRLYKNNSDFAGHSYGCHDNYLMRRDIAWDRIVAGILPFLITRQIFSGAGKMGIEGESSQGDPGIYQISQRADFFSVVVSIDTMNRRPLINTRDEPHVDASRYRRFHVILGDSNMSEWATVMKIGTTALVLDLIERGEAPQLEIAQPVDANKSISRDQTCDWIIELKDGRKISAIDVQRIYLHAARELWRDPPDYEHVWILREWENVLNDLERDPMAARDRVDWAAKKFLLEALQQEEKLSWGDPWLQSIDLEYHNLDLDRGLYYELLRKGLMRRVTGEEEIKTAIFNPPETTRAFFRGRAVARFNDEISSYAPSHRSVNLASDSWQSKIASFPLDRAGRFAGDVEDHAVDALDFVADAVGNAREQFVGDAHPVCSHAVLTFHDPQGDRVFVRSLVAHNAD